MIERFLVVRKSRIETIAGKAYKLFAVEATLEISDSSGSLIKRTKTVKSTALESEVAMQLVFLELEAWGTENKAEIKSIENQYSPSRRV